MFISRFCSANPESYSVKRTKAPHKKINTSYRFGLLYCLENLVAFKSLSKYGKNFKLEASNDLLSNKIIALYLHGRFILFLPKEHTDLSLVHRFLRQLCLILTEKREDWAALVAKSQAMSVLGLSTPQLLVLLECSPFHQQGGLPEQY